VNRIAESAEANNEATASLTVTALAITGDVNRDGIVNEADLTIIRGQLGRSGSAITTPAADVNTDGRVDAADIGAVARAIGR
jgi:hypothetical protein